MEILKNNFGGTINIIINEFEDKYDLILPDDYRGFLIEFNGGYTNDFVFNIKKIDEEALLRTLFGLETTTEYGLEHWLNRFGNILPRGYLIIGADPGGNFILIGTENSDNPGVYYWDQALCFQQSTETKNYYYLADTFTDFIASLNEFIDD